MITLGLDLGHTSIGWTLADVENGEIIDGGVQVFDAPEDEKGNTNASIRRGYRGSRTTNKNHEKRILNLKKLCSKYKLVPKNLLITPKGGIAPLFKKGIQKDTPLKLRAKGLDELLKGRELTRVILHIANRRGFKFDIEDDNDKELGKIRDSQNELKNEFAKCNYRTYGEFLYKEYELKDKKTRNRAKKDGTPDYKFSIHRDDLADELEEIFTKQKALKNQYVTDEFIAKIKQELLFVNEPKSLKRMIGDCSLIKGKKRASKALYSSEIFVARGILVNLRVKEPDRDEYRALDRDEIELLLKEGHSQKIGKTEAKKILKISNKSKFKGDEEDSNKPIVHLESFLKMKKAIDNEELFQKLFSNIELYENIVNLLTYEKSFVRRKEKLNAFLEESKLSDDEQKYIFNKVIYLSFSGYLNISTDAVKKILPYLENGYRVDQAILEQDMKIEVEPQLFLPPLKDTELMIPNPIVVRAITKSRHLINAILKKYREEYNDDEWTFDRLNIELAREINTQKEKKEITSAQTRDSNNKKRAVEFIIEKCGEKFVTSKNILKVRLWQQQDEYCLYSLSKYEDAKDAKITTDDIVNEIVYKGDAFDIDHILPISRSSDDSISNKVLVYSDENRAKSNKTPYEYFGKDKERWEKFENLLRPMFGKLGKAKVGKLTMKDFASREQGFLERHLNDTRIISKTVKNYVEKYLKFKDNNQERRVYVVSGKLTSTLRHQWGLENKNRENHYHHFEDAVLIAFSNASIVNRLSKYYHALETHKRDGKDKPRFTKPYENFVDDINAMVKEINVVREPKVKNSGKVHSDNPRKKDEKARKGMEVRGGIVDNGEIVRTDVFKDIKKEKYFLIPFYLKDLNKPLPTKFITAGGKEWEAFDVTKHKFVFTLYPNDLVKVITKTEVIQGYYISPHTGTANITLISMDNVDDGIFTKSIEKHILKVFISNHLDTDSRKEHIEKMAKLPNIKKRKPTGVLALMMDIKINDVKEFEDKKNNLELILEELSENYSIDSFKNNTKTVAVVKIDKNDNEIKLTVTLDTIYDNRALRGTGVKTKTLGFKKLNIDLLGEITEAPYETVRKPFVKKKRKK